MIKWIYLVKQLSKNLDYEDYFWLYGVVSSVINCGSDRLHSLLTIVWQFRVYFNNGHHVGSTVMSCLHFYVFSSYIFQLMLMSDFCETQRAFHESTHVLLGWNSTTEGLIIQYFDDTQYLTQPSKKTFYGIFIEDLIRGKRVRLACTFILPRSREWMPHQAIFLSTKRYHFAE